MLGRMKPTFDVRNAFLARQPIPGVAFQHNDYVKVVSGPYAPDSGSLVSVEELGSDPVYLVELESREDQLIPQSCLEFIAHD